MTVIRCTAKLLKLVAGSPTTNSLEPHATDWYANLLWLDGRKCLLMVHSTTLFAVFEPEIAKAHVIPLGRFALSLIERELTAERAVTTGSDLPRAERLASRLYSLAERSTLDAHSLADDDYIEDYLTISRVEPGVLWFEGGGLAPLEVGEAASRLAKPGWSVNIVMGRQGGRWHVLEVGNVYPN